MKRWLVILVIILLALVVFLGWWEYMNAPTGFPVFTGDECIQNGGEIVNTLGEKTWDDKNIIGEIEGMRCPCLCVKK